MSDENVKKVFEWGMENMPEALRRFGWELADLAEMSACCTICKCSLCRAIRHQWATGQLPSASATDVSCTCAFCRIVIRGIQNCNGDLGDCPVKLLPEDLEQLGIRPIVN
jgi:hypothetical protein